MANSKFDFIYKGIINESIIDIPRNSLDPQVWEFPDGGHPIMHPSIKVQILEDIGKIENIVPVKEFFAIGSILTHRYSKTSDIDINVVIDEQDFDNISREALVNLAVKLNGNLASGTSHPINYFFVKGEFDTENADGIYDVANERWVKEPISLNTNVQKYWNMFQAAVGAIDANTAELRRDVIDYEQLTDLSKEDTASLRKMLEDKLEEIEEDVQALISNYKGIRLQRMDAFSKPLSLKQIKKYRSKNLLPENVIYKLLERYHYWRFIHKLKNIIGDDETIDQKDIKQIKQAGKELWA